MNVQNFYPRLYWVMTGYSVFLAVLTWFEVITTAMNPVVLALIAFTWGFSYVGCSTIIPDKALKERSSSILPMLIGAAAMIYSVIKLSTGQSDASIGLMFTGAVVLSVFVSPAVGWLLNKYFEPQYVAILKEQVVKELYKVKNHYTEGKEADVLALDNLINHAMGTKSLKDLHEIERMVDNYNKGVKAQEALIKFAEEKL